MEKVAERTSDSLYIRKYIPFVYFVLHRSQIMHVQKLFNAQLILMRF